MSARQHVDEFLAFIAAVASATEEATEAQKAEMQSKLVPEIQILLATKNPDHLKWCDALLFQIMGAGWAPRGEWAHLRANAHSIIDQGIRDRGEDPVNVFAPPR